MVSKKFFLFISIISPTVYCSTDKLLDDFESNKIVQLSNESATTKFLVNFTFIISKKLHV